MEKGRLKWRYGHYRRSCSPSPWTWNNFSEWQVFWLVSFPRRPSHPCSDSGPDECRVSIWNLQQWICSGLSPDSLFIPFGQSARGDTALFIIRLQRYAFPLERQIFPGENVKSFLYGFFRFLEEGKNSLVLLHGWWACLWSKELIDCLLIVYFLLR